MHEQMHEYIAKCMHDQVYARMNQCMHACTNTWMNECMNDRWMHACMATWQPEVGAMQNLSIYAGNHQVMPCTISLSRVNKWKTDNYLAARSWHYAGSKDHNSSQSPPDPRRSSHSQSQAWRPMTRVCSSPLAYKTKKMTRRNRRRWWWWQALLQRCWGIYIFDSQTLSFRQRFSWLQWVSFKPPHDPCEIFVWISVLA